MSNDGSSIIYDLGLLSTVDTAGTWRAMTDRRDEITAEVNAKIDSLKWIKVEIKYDRKTFTFSCHSPYRRGVKYLQDYRFCKIYG